MAVTGKLIMAKARGFTISIEKMNDKDRIRTPNGDFGKDYNRLLAAAKQLYPDIADLLPPTVGIYESGSGSEYTDSHYSELDSYCEQIFQLVSECGER